MKSTSIKRTRTIVVTMMWCLWVAACGYKGTPIFDPPYLPTPPTPQFTKIPVHIGFIDDTRLSNFHFQGGRHGAQFDLLLGPMIRDAFVQELAATFSQISFISKPSDSDKVDLYVYPFFVALPQQSTESFQFLTRIRITNKADNTPLFITEYSLNCDFSPPEGALAAGMLGATSLYALSPITEPIKNDLIGKNSEKKALDTLSAVMHGLGEQIKSEQSNINKLRNIFM